MSLGPVSRNLVKTATSAPAAEDRALATQAIGRAIRDIELSDDERRLSERLFDILSRDVNEEVRRALAVTLRVSRNLPRAVANRLINDIDSIALPILSGSPCVTDDDLILAMRSRAADKVRAVATRNGLSERLSRAVMSFGDRDAVLTLAANDTALISEEDARRLVRMATQDDLIREAALRRQDMPQSLAAQLIERQVEQVDQTLAPETDQHAEISRDTEARAKASWTASDWSSDAIQSFATALHERDKLTSAVIARAAGQGDWRFVQIALAKLAGISSAKASMMVLDPIPFGLKALIQRAGLNDAARDLLLVSAQAFRDLEQSGEMISRPRFQRLMTERIATHPSSEQHETLWLDWLDDGLKPQLVEAD